MTRRDQAPDPERSERVELRLVPGAFRNTDSGNAERFVARFKGDVHYLSKRDKWLFWNGSEWELDEGGAVARRIKATVRGINLEAAACSDMKQRQVLEAWAHKSEGVGKRSAIETLARAEPGVTIGVDELDADPWLLNCNNGTLDLRTGELHSHRRDDLITKTTGVAYDPAARSELWEQVLQNMTGGDAELASYLQRIAGYALTGVATERKFFFLYGPPGSGKSTYIEAMMGCMGSYARATPFDTWIEHNNPGQNRDDLVALQGVRLVTSGEVSPNKHWDTATIKQITGGDLITATAKFEAPISFHAQCTIMMAANDAPKAREDDAGFWERMNRVPIVNVLPAEQRIKGLHELLRSPEHSSAVLAWAVEGCRAWQDTGIGTAAVVTASTDAYREENDWLAGFLEGYELDEFATILAPNFRSQYEQYCKNEGQRPEATKTLARRIEKRCAGVRYKMTRGVRLWSGLRIKADPGPEYHQGELGLPAQPPAPPTQPDMFEDPNPYEEEELF